jgi:hypothetical protein
MLVKNTSSASLQCKSVAPSFQRTALRFSSVSVRGSATPNLRFNQSLFSPRINSLKATAQQGRSGRRVVQNAGYRMNVLYTTTCDAPRSSVAVVASSQPQASDAWVPVCLPEELPKGEGGHFVEILSRFLQVKLFAKIWLSCSA